MAIASEKSCEHRAEITRKGIESIVKIGLQLGWGNRLDRNKHASIAHSVELSMMRLGGKKEREIKLKSQQKKENRFDAWRRNPGKRYTEKKYEWETSGGTQRNKLRLSTSRCSCQPCGGFHIFVQGLDLASSLFSSHSAPSLFFFSPSPCHKNDSQSLPYSVRPRQNSSYKNRFPILQKLSGNRITRHISRLILGAPRRDETRLRARRYLQEQNGPLQ
ncbi:hypothetical protein BDW59DRAFT_42312 [Aspergillus cavernicola]|uniref:Uncharacterized protein n=1 Tax=Aspergillus cavernicola TaxID=176166 RepID=A0ABR4IN47_9EURO